MRSIHLNTTYYYQYYAILLSILHNTTLLPFSGARAVTPESEDENLIPSQPVSPLPTPASSPLPDTGRRKASAAVTSINPAHVLATVSGHRKKLQIFCTSSVEMTCPAWIFPSCHLTVAESMSMPCSPRCTLRPCFGGFRCIVW